MLFEHIVINSVQGEEGGGRCLCSGTYLPRRLYSLLILSRECVPAWWRGQWSADRVLGMCLLWRETVALIWESQMEATLWRVGRQPWQFCSEQHPAVSFLTPPSCPLVSCQGRFSFYLGYSAVKYPWVDCVMSLYIWPQISALRKGLSSQLNKYCAVKIHLFKWTVPWVSANAQCLMSITQPHANFPRSSLQSIMSQPTGSPRMSLCFCVFQNAVMTESFRGQPFDSGFTCAIKIHPCCCIPQ